MHIESKSWQCSRYITCIGLAVVFASLIAAIIQRFLPWMPSVFYGDDLDYFLSFLDGRCGTKFSGILTTICYERFRPIASGFVLAEMNLFGPHINYYLAVNSIILGLTATLAFAIAKRLSHGNWLIALAIAFAVATSRFAAYQVTQVIGPVEGIPLALTLSMIYVVIRADQGDCTLRWCWFALLLCFLATNTHERFIVTAPWLGMAYLLSPKIRSLPQKHHLALLAGCIAVPAFYVAYKIIALRAPFFIGTGGTHLGIDLRLILEHFVHALLSVFGFNDGPDYLVGTSVSLGWNVMCMLAVIFATCWVIILGLGLYRVQSNQPIWVRLRWPLLLLAAAAALVAPALLTIRLEQRWLFASFVVILFVSAWAVGAVSHKLRALLTSMIIFMCLASITLDTLIMKQFDKVFFISSPRFAEIVKRDVADKLPQNIDDIALLADANQCSWTLSNGGFFRVYGGHQLKVSCFSSLDAAANAKLPLHTHLYAENSKQILEDVTAALSQVKQRASEEEMVFNFLKEFPNGLINDSSKVDSPTGHGALLIPWNSTTGANETLTVISGFSYRYDDVPVAANAQLRFAVGMVYPSSESARAVLRLNRGDSAPVEIYSRDLIPPEAGADLRFESVSISLKAYAKQHVSISFAVESPSGHSAGHWVAFVDPRIVLVDGTK